MGVDYTLWRALVTDLVTRMLKHDMFAVVMCFLFLKCCGKNKSVQNFWNCIKRWGKHA